MAETTVELHGQYLGILVQASQAGDHNNNATLQYGTAVSEW